MMDMVETIEEEEEEDMTAIKYLTHLYICLSHHYITFAFVLPNANFEYSGGKLSWYELPRDNFLARVDIAKK
ncbi:MAG: hypothetical protein ACI90V_011982 [Bacillariaceae sp.]|jgi:hypothetical protein